MSCTRCNVDAATATGWCPTCELSYDAWNRRNASDIIVSAFAGAFVLLALGVGLPLIGVDVIVAATAAFAGFGTIAGIHRLARRRRRRQFLGAGLPRAYLLAKT
ncbi:MAG: hypothetical protein H0T79_02440 [Deltaproteobacteria bacterium]|nr:hypothetical protein [Deltaproteobacteria bacterium]